MAKALKPWGKKEKEAWRDRQTIQRSYQHDVVDRLKALPGDKFKLEQYGALSQDPKRYPLYFARTQPWNDNNPTIAITGGVHGYEPSGVTGALRFLEEIAPKFQDRINFVVYPCISPWSYEVNHRWTSIAEDPNRNFHAKGIAEESLKLMASVKSLKLHFNKSVDLHETNDRDKELGREREARDGKPHDPAEDYIPEGFYLVVASKNDIAFGKEVIEEVRKVTPICTDKEILGYPSDGGIIVIDDLNTLCQDFFRKISDVSVTTEIYPEKCSRQESEDAQLTTIQAAINNTLRMQP